MESAKKTSEKLFLAMIAEQCLKDIEDIDYLVVQLAMNKADKKKEFESARSEMKNNINNFRMELASQIDQEYTFMDNLLGDLEMEKDIVMIRLACQFTLASLKVHLQFEILEKNLKKNKTVITAKYNEEMINALEKTNTLVHKIPETVKKHTIKWESFMKEINTSYLHLKKAVHSL